MYFGKETFPDEFFWLLVLIVFPILGAWKICEIIEWLYQHVDINFI